MWGRALAVTTVVAFSACASESTDATDGTTRPPESLAEEACVQLNSVRPTQDLVEAVPPDLAAAAQVVVDLSDLLGREDSDRAVAPPGLLENMTSPGTADEFDTLAAATRANCDETGPEWALGMLARASEAAAAPGDRAYCRRLTELIDVESTDADIGGLAGLGELAPDAHSDALAAFGALSRGEEPTTDDEAADLAGSFAGLGAYAEARCALPGAFATMFALGALGGRVEPG